MGGSDPRDEPGDFGPPMTAEGRAGARNHI